MKEQGIVTRIISSRLAEVAFQRSEACAKCKACHAVGEGMMGIEAINEIGARRDDIVEIEIPSGEVVKGSIVVFLLPIFFLAAGYLLGSAVSGGSEAAGVIFALISLALSFLAIRWYDKNIQQKEALRARILRVISSR